MSFCIIAYLHKLGQDMSVKFHPGAGDVFQLSVSKLGAQEYLSHAIRGHRPISFQILRKYLRSSQKCTVAFRALFLLGRATERVNPVHLWRAMLSLILHPLSNWG